MIDTGRIPQQIECGFRRRTVRHRIGKPKGYCMIKKAKTAAKTGAKRPARKPATNAKTTASRQVFSYRAPTALSVMLAGEFTHWQKEPVPMKRGKDGVWKASVALEPGVHHYKFSVDGQWQDDPECEVRVPNPYGGHDSVRNVA